MPEPALGEAPGRALHRHGLRPRRQLGQNFLRDRSFLTRIVAATGIALDDELLEIGAGTGVLTGALVREAKRVLAVELDDELFRLLQTEFSDVPNLQLWHGNALAFDPCVHFPGDYKLVGNIPYYVTGPILRHFLEAACRPSLLVLMVQWEVAQRITARPGRLSLLGVSVQYYARPEVVTRVPARAFMPRPKVDSAIVRLSPYTHERSREEIAHFFEVVRAGFSARRKQLANALGIGLGAPRHSVEELLICAGIEGTRRAETLTVEEWRQLGAAWGAMRPAMEE